MTQTPQSRHGKLRAWTQLVGACTVLGVAAAVLLHVELGMDPYGVLLSGAAGTSGLSFGTVNVILGLLLAGACWGLGKVKPAPGTLVQPVVAGIAVDLTLPLLPTVEGYGSRLLLGILAVTVLGAAAGTYLGAGLGSGPFDSVPTALRRVWPEAGFGKLYTGTLVVSLGLGMLLGGVVGVGTVVMVSVLGPIVSRAKKLTSPAPRAVTLPEQRRSPDVQTAETVGQT